MLDGAATRGLGNMSIKPLPDHVVAQIKSSAVVTSLNGVVDGLLRNSLDAHATQVNIAVDYGRGSCSVEDNGHGIPPAEFLQDGGLGKLHRKPRRRPGCGLHYVGELTVRRYLQTSGSVRLSRAVWELPGIGRVPVSVDDLVASSSSCLAQLSAPSQL